MADLNLAGTPHHWAQPWAAGAAEAALAEALALAAQWLQPRQRCSTHEYVLYSAKRFSYTGKYKTQASTHDDNILQHPTFVLC